MLIGSLLSLQRDLLWCLIGLLPFFQVKNPQLVEIVLSQCERPKSLYHVVPFSCISELDKHNQINKEMLISSMLDCAEKSTLSAIDSSEKCSYIISTHRLYPKYLDLLFERLFEASDDEVDGFYSNFLRISFHSPPPSMAWLLL
jgi:hypothetical protein